MSRFIKLFFHFNQPQISPYRILGAGLCMLIVLFTGYFTGNMHFANMGSLGIFLFLYYQPLPASRLLKRLFFIGLYLYICLVAGMFIGQTNWWYPLVIGTLALIGRFTFRIFEVKKPGSFFGIMVLAMGASFKVPLNHVIPLSLYFIVGALVAISVSFLFLMTERNPFPPSSERSIHERIRHDPGSVIDSLFYGITIFGAAYLSQGLQLHNPYWTVISCASILMGDNLQAIMHRNIQRIFGTTIGVAIAAFIFSVPLSRPFTLILITCLFMLIEFLMPRNYGVANFFTTPMALLLSTLATNHYSSSLLADRLIGIALGSIVGLLSAYLFVTGLKFYHQSLLIERPISFPREPKQLD